MAHQFFFNPFILDGLPAPATGFDVVQDLSEPRLRMYITSRGVKTFFVRKRVGGRDKRIIIGKYPDMDVEDARLAVPKILDTAMQPKPSRRRKITFGEFVPMYMSGRIRREEFAAIKLARSMRRHLGDLYEKNIVDITATDITNVINKIDGNATAARMQELIQSIFKYAIELGYAKTNPVTGIARRAQNRRVRPLTVDGLRNLVATISNMDDLNLRAAFLMLVYGFAPKSQIFAMEWADLDFNHDTWRDAPLSDRAVVLLQDLPQDSPWVFRGRGLGHLTDPRVVWRRVVNDAGVPDLTMDDVNKFLARKLKWSSNIEEFRANMNDLLDEMLGGVILDELL